jgi:hypothetical protein
MEPAIRSGTLSHMNDKSASVLQFLNGREICQIAFGMYDLQINWGDGGLSCTGRVIYTPSAGEEVVWTEGHRSMQYQCCVFSSRQSKRLTVRRKGN